VPFANLAGDPGLDYAVQGLTDTIATELSARGLYRVISMEASAHYRNATASPQRIASELRADALVLGSVVRDGASFVVNVRLVDGRTERPLWAKRFVRATKMELTFSDDVVTGLATALALEPQPARPVGGAEVAMARDEYLCGRHFWNMRTAEGLDAAVQHLTRAIEIDRGYALAWAGLADVYAAGGDTPSALFAPWPGPLEAGLRSAEEALRLDPSLGEAHAALGRFRMMQWRWNDAERELSEAVRLSPNYAPARQWYGTLLLRLRKCPAAIEQTAVGAEIDPITPIINEAVGTTLSGCGQPERAIPAFQKVLEMHPAFASAHMRLAGAYLRRGDAASALSEYREAVRLRPNTCEFQARMTGALRALGKDDEARAIGTRVLAEAAAGRASQYCAALVHANLGDVDGAFAALDAEVAAHGRVDSVLGDFHLRGLHPDPRWSRLLDRIGLTPYVGSER
jgi:TolB-like protein/Tfp pilus assembly protein PilF